MKYFFTLLINICCLCLLEAQPPCIQLTVGNTTCGLNDGTASLYTICCGNISEAVWSNGAQGLSITGLAPGSYEVYAETFDGCARTIFFEILSSSPMPLATSLTNTKCGEANGSAKVINLDSLSGFSPYYSWNTGSNQSSISNLAAGLYTVTVYEFDPTGAEGCVQSFDFIIDPSTGIVGGLNTSPTTCNQVNGSIVAQASGGGGGYTYEWSSGQTSAAIYNLSAGNYSVNIHSADGCSPLMLSDVVLPSTAITGSIIPKHTTCNLANGALEVMASGGGISHTYTWSNGQTSSVINNLPAGGYSVIIHSSDGCTPLNLAENINSSSALVATIEEIHTTCGESNGSLSAFANHNGTTYSWNTGATATIIEGLSPGTYSLTATDTDGCTSIATSYVNPSQGFNLSVAQEGNSLVASTEIFTLYEWLDCSNNSAIPGAEDKTFTPAANGLYSVAVYNGNFNGVTCRDTSDCIDFIKTANEENFGTGAYIYCSTFSNGFIDLKISSDMTIHKVKIYNINGQLLQQKEGLFSNEITLDISDAPMGTLFLQCHTSKGLIAKRILKI